MVRAVWAVVATAAAALAVLGAWRGAHFEPTQEAARAAASGRLQVLAASVVFLGLALLAALAWRRWVEDALIAGAAVADVAAVYILAGTLIPPLVTVVGAVVVGAVAVLVLARG